MAVSRTVAAVGMIVIAVVAFVAGLFASPLVFPPAVGDPIWDNIVERGTIRVGSSPDWPPFENLSATGEFMGFEVELVETIAERLDLAVEWKNMGFELIITEIKKGAAATIDLGVSGFSVKKARLAEVQFTLYHSISVGQIIMLESRRVELGITEIDSLGELVDLGLSCGTGDGTTEQEELMAEAPGSLVTFSDFLTALEDLKLGGIDCVYAETPVTTEWIALAEPGKELAVIYSRPYYPVAFIAHKDADTLVEKINSELAEMIVSGELDALKQKWHC